MLQHIVLRVGEIFVLVFAVVYGSDQDETSACLHAKSAFESQGITLFEIATDPASGSINVMFCLFT